jgi:TetR/AcrR family transcriptional repressor of nem operon
VKVSKERAAEHHRAIIKAAARLFREHGFGGVNVAEIMNEAGLTHGAFYGHFDSKVALAAEACRYAFEDRLDAWTDKVSLSSYLDEYISASHRDKYADGCPMVAFASEIHRQEKAVQKQYAQGVSAYTQRIAERLSAEGVRKPQANSRAAGIVAAMVGAVALARSTAWDKELSSKILLGTRASIATRFGS